MEGLALDFTQFDPAVDIAESETLFLFKSPPTLTVVEWAENNRILSAENCALPGPYRIAVTPFLKEPLECLTDPRIERVYMQKSAQVAWTDGVVNNYVGYHIDQDPAPMLILFPTDSMAQRYSKEKLAPMIRDSNTLRGKVAEPKSRDSGNTILSKNYKGGHMELVGSNSPVNLSSSPIRILVVEEPDRCAANSGREGNSIKLALERTKTFHNRKVIMGGSPTIKGMSEIEREMELSDQRYYFIPCPHCGEYQALDWSMVVWDKEKGRDHPVFGDHVPESARLRCDYCEKTYTNNQKIRQLKKGHWEPSSEFNGIAGFYINELYSPFPKATLADIAAKFLEAKKKQDAGDDSLMITWVNTSLGEPWEEKGEAIKEDSLAERVEDYSEDELDPGVLCITCAVDIQDDRLEYEVLGWGEDEENWSIEYNQIDGDPEGQEVWDKLDLVIFGKRFKRKGVELKVACTCIDSGAHTNAVYRYVLPRQFKRVYAVKGSSKAAEPIVGKPSKKSIKKGLKLFPIGTDTAKVEIFGRLKVEKPGPGYCHFPDHYPLEYFKQLTAEELVTRFERGVEKRIWKKIRKRNEALDLRVYNVAALYILNPNFQALRKRLEDREKKKLTDKPTPVQKKAVTRRRKRRPGARKNFVNNY